MIRELLTDNQTVRLLKRGLEATTLRHRVISDNIVNTGVPGYQPREVRFESLFTEAMRSSSRGRQTSSDHRSIDFQRRLPQPEVVDRESDLDAAAALEAEMVALVENSQKHRALIKLLSGSYGSIMTAIRGRVSQG